MKQEKKIARAFYRHAESGQILVIERSWSGIILGSCPATEPLKDLAEYQITPKNNLWIQENSDKLILIESR